MAATRHRECACLPACLPDCLPACHESDRRHKCYANMTVGEDTAIAHDRGEIAMEAILVRDQRTTSHRVLEHGTSPSKPMGADCPGVGPTDTKRYKRILDKRSFLYEAAISPTIERNERNERRLSRDSACPVPAFYDDRGIRSRRNPSSDVTATTWLSKSNLLHYTRRIRFVFRRARSLSYFSHVSFIFISHLFIFFLARIIDDSLFLPMIRPFFLLPRDNENFQLDKLGIPSLLLFSFIGARSSY